MKDAQEEKWRRKRQPGVCGVDFATLHMLLSLHALGFVLSAARMVPNLLQEVFPDHLLPYLPLTALGGALTKGQAHWSQ